MNEMWKSVCDSLPKGDELKKGYVKKLHQLFPVPNDYKIEWAITEQFGKNPQGLVITDKGIVLKSNQTSPDDDTASTPIYFIIPWHQFDPDEYKLSVLNGKVTLTMGEGVSAYFSNLQIGAFFVKSMEKKRQFNAEEAHFAEASAAAELNSMGLKDTVFAAAYGADSNPTGHGIYAEEAGAILDKLNGERVEVVGRDNAKNGPDKVVNGQAVQCKYCKSSTSSVNGCFKTNPATGLKEFRYYNQEGAPMMIEVPKDQYVAAIEALKKKILENQVPGVTDPNVAYSIIRPGKLTYAQAKNLAKAGTFESITYDVATGTVNCAFAFGISVLTTFGFTYASGKNTEEALKSAAEIGFQTFGLTLASHVLASQLAKTGLSKTMAPLSQAVVKKIGKDATHKIINAMRTLSGKKAIYGCVANKSLAKALGSNAIVVGVQLVVFSVPDTYRFARRKMSGGQYTQNMTSLLASIIGASTTAIATGIATGKIAEKFGKKVSPRAGRVIGFVGGFAGGASASYGTTLVGKAVREDDSVIMLRLFNGVLINIFIDNLLDDKEMEQFFKRLEEDSACKKEIKKVLGSIYGADNQYQEIEYLCNSILEPILAKREVITKDKEPDEDVFSDALGDVLSRVAEEESE